MLNCIKLFNLKKSAFTLAEIVIALGIIGTVATLTITNSVKSTNEKEIVFQLKKSYSILETAFQNAINEDGPIESWRQMAHTGSSDSTHGEKYGLAESHIFPKLSLLNNCNHNSAASTCWKAAEIGGSRNASVYSSPASNISNNTYHAKALMANGASVAIYMSNTTATGTSEGAGAIGYIAVDVDGPTKGSYRWGDDVFLFYILNDGSIIPAGFEMNPAASNACTTYGDLCTAWVLHKSNRDYLKNCGKGPGRLSWTNTTSSSCTD